MRNIVHKSARVFFIFALLALLLGAPSRQGATLGTPSLSINGLENSSITICDSTLFFSAFGPITLHGTWTYKWVLYKNGAEINKSQQTITCTTSVPCEFPSFSYKTAAMDGSYYVRLQYTNSDTVSNKIQVKVGTGNPSICPPAEKGNLLHLAGVSKEVPTANPRLWHTIRFATAFTWQDFRDVELVAGDRGNFVDIDCSVVNNQLHVVGVTSNGKLWHTIRYGAGSGWQPFGNVGDAVPPPKLPTGEEARRVAAAEVAGDLHVCVLTVLGNLYHTIRYSKQPHWQGFGEVITATGPPDDGDKDFADVGCSGINGELHVVVVNRNKGNLYHTIRHANSWQFLGNVRVVAGPPFLQEKFTSVAAGELNGELQVCVTTEQGKLYHTIRHTNTWQFFGNVTEKTSPPPNPPNDYFVDVSCGQSGGELHVVGVTKDGGLWHTIRHNVGWDKFGNVEQSNAGERGKFTAVSVAGHFIP